MITCCCAAVTVTWMDESNGWYSIICISEKLAHSPSYSPAGVGLGESIIAFDRTLASSRNNILVNYGVNYIENREREKIITKQ